MNLKPKKKFGAMFAELKPNSPTEFNVLVFGCLFLDVQNEFYRI